MLYLVRCDDGFFFDLIFGSLLCKHNGNVVAVTSANKQQNKAENKPTSAQFWRVLREKKHLFIFKIAINMKIELEWKLRFI